MAYPGDRRFTADNFGDCSLIEVEQAMYVLNRRDFEQANLYTAPIAEIGRWIARNKGLKDVPEEMFNPYALVLYKEEARAELDSAIARCWLELTAEHKVPGWAIAAADMKLIRAVA